MGNAQNNALGNEAEQFNGTQNTLQKASFSHGSQILDGANGKILVENAAGTSGVELDVTTDGTVTIKTRADATGGQVTAAGINAGSYGMTTASDILNQIGAFTSGTMSPSSGAYGDVAGKSKLHGIALKHLRTFRGKDCSRSFICTPRSE